ncbi:MAG: peptide ABC transporter substrate-binding protein [Clostridiales bacterium]|jgi:oligopeptide transport system substrate-binding protein|nr:peptide ABC transporter substrate-binding protein [Clostridiales bacterium]MDR2712947.1 peptide ABC transporter substrate-binding protein [Clostridiales bacterium]
MKKTKLMLVVTLVMMVALALTLTACFGSGSKSENAAAQSLIFASLPLQGIDPQQFNAAPSYVIIKGFAEGLVHTWQGEIKPGVAESWEIADDNMTMTFHLRQDACWSDGSPLIADDFVYGFRRLVDPENNASYRWVAAEIVNGEEIAYGDGSIPVEALGVEAPDDHTFVIHFNTPAPYYLGFLDLPPFYPTKQEWVERYGDRYASSPDTILGNGPFKLEEYLLDDRVVMVPNDNYWNKKDIKLKKVTALIMNEETGFAMFESGAVDWARIPVGIASNYLQNPGTLPPDATGYTYKSGAVDWFCINIASATNRILGNQDFRLALNYALDREEYIAITSGDLYSPATRFVLPTVSGFKKPYCEEYPINFFKTKAEQDKAQEHLQKAMSALGISDPGDISFSITVAETTPKAIAENCQDQWRRTLGINVDIETVTYAAMIENRIAGTFDLIYAGWMPDYDDPYTYLGYFMSNNSQNGGKYSNPRYDELVGTANNFADQASRLAMYAEAEELLIREAGIVPLQVREVPAVVRKGLENFVHFYLGMEQDYIYAYYK